jgi:Flp pilus assembly protein TadG
MLKDLHRLVARVRLFLRFGEEGSNLVEFALVLPVLIGLITGIVSLGSAMMNYESLIHGVAAGAQTLATIRTSTTNPCADAFAAFTAAAPTLNTSATGFTFTVTLNGTAVASTSCAGDQSLMAQGGSATVSATYPCNVWIYGFTIAPGCELPATVTEYEF